MRRRRASVCVSVCRRKDIPEGKRKKDFLSAVEAAHKALQERRTESMKSVDAVAAVLRQKSQEYLQASAVPQPHPQLTRVLTHGLSRAADAAAALSTSAKAYEPRTSLGAMLKGALFDDKPSQASVLNSPLLFCHGSTAHVSWTILVCLYQPMTRAKTDATGRRHP